MATEKIREIIKDIPVSSGVYIFKDKDGRVLYVGKAVSLRSRVRSHFSARSLKRDVFLALVDRIEYIECLSEEQALILEASLIKEKKPRYNIALRDDKSYPYVEITREDYPRVTITRTRQTRGRDLIGPFARTGVLKDSLSLIREIFPFCSCKKRARRPCLYYHIKLCPGPCRGQTDKKAYRRNIAHVKKILKGERKKLFDHLRSEMEDYSRRQKFEEAALLRDKLTAIENLYKGKRQSHFLLGLKEKLGLACLPLWVEAIDISCLSGTSATGSVVVFRDGLSDKSSYRRYKIKAVSGIDDYAMIAEVVRRRYQRLARESERLPDLVVIDGGQGHLKVAAQEVKKLGLELELISIAKRNEEIWTCPDPKPHVFPRTSPELQFVQRVRDEAHRFAKSYHTYLRKKTLAGKAGPVIDDV